MHPPWHQNRKPLHFLQELMEITGDKGGKQIINRHPDDVVYLEIKDARELVDIDTL